MKKFTKSLLAALLAAIMLFCLCSCGSGEPYQEDTPKGAPYEGYYEMDRMNNSCSYNNKGGVNNFNITMKWKTKDESVESATYTDEYYLEYSAFEGGPYELCQPTNPNPEAKLTVYTIKPGEDAEFNPDVDSMYDGLPMGYYRFVKVFDVKKTDGSSEKRIAHFSFDMSGNN